LQFHNQVEILASFSPPRMKNHGTITLPDVAHVCRVSIEKQENKEKLITY